MIHKTSDPFYHDDIEKLAENMGDLRYDVLAKFLLLLSDKIKKDGEKDLRNGRIKLANSLDLASKSLNNAVKNIEASWAISWPYILPKDIIHKIKSEFKNREEQEEVVKLISEDWILECQSDFRVARCLLYGTNGDIKKLRQNYEDCRQDPRNIMLWAEYDNDSNWLRYFGNPFGEEYMFDKANFETQEYNTPKRIDEQILSLAWLPLNENEADNEGLPF